MKKLISIFLAFSLCIGTCFASGTTSTTDNIPEYISDTMSTVTYLDCSAANIGYDFKELMDEAFESNALIVNVAGKFEVIEPLLSIIVPQNIMDDFNYRIGLLNSAIDMGLLEVDPVDGAVDETQYTKQQFSTLSQQLIVKDEGSVSTESITQSSEHTDTTTPQATHYCTYGKLSVGFMVSANRQILVDYYESILAVNPTVAINSTIGYWIGRVAPGKSWDYKTDPEIGPWDHMWCCDYWTYTNVHKTAEWIGNYNYGYTGSFLFSLDVLKAGSFAVGGFDPSDYDDWPAIEEGYLHST